MGARLIRDLNPAGSSTPESIISIDGLLFFTADLGAGTSLEPPIDEDTSDSDENATEESDNANQGQALGQGIALLKSDGTAEGTKVLKEYQSINELIEVNGELYFIADDGKGNRLWRSNGTARGTVLVKDLYPGADPNFPQDLFEIDEVLFYSAINSTSEGGIPAENGYELWRREGEGVGTPIFKNIIPDKIITGVTIEVDDETGETTTTVTTEEVQNDSFPRDFTAVNGNIFFVAATPYFLEKEEAQEDPLNLRDRDITGGLELWFSDGTESGTRPIVINSNLYEYYAPGDIEYGYVPSNLYFPNYGFTTNSASSFPRELTTFEDNLVFVANDGIHGFELWKIDEEGNHLDLIDDLREGSISSSPEQLTVVNDHLYFTADTGRGRKLWRTSSALETPVLVNGGGDDPKHLKAIDDKLYFSAQSEKGREFWVAEGTTASLVADINAGRGSSSPSNFTSFKGQGYEEEKSTVFFTANDGHRGIELWSYDPNIESLKPDRYADIFDGPSSSEPRNLVNAEEVLYFTADNGNSGRELWTLGVTIQGPTGRNNGQSSTTIQIEEQTKKVYQYISDSDVTWSLNGGDDSDLFTINKKGWLKFKEKSNYKDPKDSDLDNTYGVRVRATDKQFGSTSDQLVNVEVTALSGDSNQGDGTNGDSENNPQNENKILKSTLVKNIYSGQQSSNPSHLTSLEDEFLLLAADNGKKGNELWRSNGSKKTTSLLKDINKGFEGSNPSEFTTYKSLSFFSADNGKKGQELWISNGKKKGTKLVSDVNPGAEGSFPSDLVVVDQRLFFAADDGKHGRELWSYSIEHQTSSMVLDIQTKANIGSNPGELTNFNGQIMFAADDQIYGRELWISDGTRPGTQLLNDINPGGLSSNPTNLSVLNRKLYFTAESYLLGGRQIFRLDNQSNDGTTAIVLENGENTGIEPSDLHASSHQLFFSAETTFEPTPEPTPSGPSTGESADSVTDPGGFMIAADGIEAKALDYIENYNGRIDSYRRFDDNADALNSARYWADALATSSLVGNNDASLAEDWNQYYQPLSDQSLSTSLPIRIPDGIPSSAARRSTTTSPGDSSDTPDAEDINNNRGRELWISNGEADGHQLLKDINPGAGSSNPRGFHTVGSKTYFSADNGVHGEELWVTDGTEAGTYLVSDINEGTGDSSPRSINDLSGTIYFSAKTDQYGRELWRLDDNQKKAVRIVSSGAGKKKLRALEGNANEFRFELAGQFGKHQADRITGFDSEEGDQLALGRDVFDGLDDIDLVTVTSKKQLRTQRNNSTALIYFEPKGKLYFNQNGDESGYGDEGGLFAILKGGPDMRESAFRII